MNKNILKYLEGRYCGLFNDSFPPAIDGVSLTVENYARNMLALGLDPCIVTPANPAHDDSHPYRLLRYFSLPIVGRYPYRYGYPKLDPFIRKRLRNIPFAIVHSHSPFSSGRLAVYTAKYHKIPLIGTFHSKYRMDLVNGFRYTPWMVDIIMKKIMDFFNSCDEVWIPQAEVEDTVREYGYKGRLTVMDNGNDMTRDNTITKDDAKKSLGIPADTVSLLFVGQNIREKGIEVIAHALAQLDTPIHWQMTYIGEGNARKELTELIATLGLNDKVQVLGPISDRDTLKKHYRASDLFLFPSFYDNAPLVVREAASAATPALLAKGSTAAAVIEDGVNGFCADASAEEYSRAISTLISDVDLLHHAGIQASQTLVRSWEDVMDEVIDRYTTLIANHHG